MFKIASLLMLLAFVASAVASNTDIACNKWIRGHEIMGLHPTKVMLQRDLHWCRKACMKAGDDCEAYTFVGNLARNKRMCKMYKLTGAKDTPFLHHVEHRSVVSFIGCNDADGTRCNKLESKVRLDGGRELEPPFAIKDFSWCKKRCMMNSACNAFNFDHRRGHRICTLLDVPAGELTRTRDPAIWSMVMCGRYGQMPVCGVKNGPLCINTDGPQCEDGLRSSHENKCICGGLWEPCCDGGCDGESRTCNLDRDDFGTCEPCGGDKDNDYQTCCDGNTCNQDDKRRVCQPWGQCAPCGAQWAPVCAEEPHCERGLKPDEHGRQCVPAVPVW